MKAKLKFDTAVIKNFFSQHWEKLVVAGSLILTLYFISSIFKRETLPSNLQPNQITRRSVEALEAVKRSDRPTEDLNPTEVPGVITPLPADKLSDYQSFIRANVLEDPNKRTDPNLFPVLAPQAKAGRGALANGDNGAGGGIMPRGAAMPPGRALDPSAPKDRSAPGGAAPAPNPRNPSGRGRRLPTPAVPGQPATPGGRSLPGLQQFGTEMGPPPIPAAFELPGPPGGGSAEARSFVIITGAVPILEQLKEFERRFSHARHAGGDEAVGLGGQFRGGQASDGDVPRYVWWRLERTDLTNGDEKTVIDYGDVAQIVADRDPNNPNSVGADLVMKSLKPSKKFLKLNNDLAQWQGAGDEVVPAEYLGDPWYCWQLPPILLRNWGREATNPKIPLVSQQAADPANPATPATEPSTDPSAPKPADDPFSKAAGSETSPIAPAPRSALPPANYSGRNFAGRGSDPSAPPRRRLPPMMLDPSAPRRGNQFNPQPNVANPDAPPVPYKLFRFVDFEVEPGHSYQYRIQLVIKNPNFGLAPELLAKPDPKPEPYRDTPWSEASPPTTVPLDTQILVEAVERPKRGEPKAKAGVLLWDKKESVELLVKSDLAFGEVANFIQKKILAVVDPVNRVIRDFTADFVSDGALLDMRGGGDEKAAVDSGGPGEMLFLVVGREGKPDQLIVVNQAADKLAIDAWEKTHKVPPGLENPDAPAFPGSSGPATRDRSTPGGLLPNRNQTQPPTRQPVTRPPGVGR